MKKLFQIEKVKALSYPAFRTLMIIHFILFLLVALIVSRIEFSVPGFSINNLYKFPNIWKFLPWTASWFNLFLAIVVILLTGNEFLFRTFRQNIIDGLSRYDLLKGKLILIFSISLYTFILVFLTGLVFGLLNTKDTTFIMFIENIHILLVYFVQAIAYMILGMLFALIFRNNALSIIMFILYFFPIEPIVRVVFPESARLFFPIKIISNLTPKPEVFSLTSENAYSTAPGGNTLELEQLGIVSKQLPLEVNTIISIGYILLFVFISGVMVRKRNF